MLFINIIPLSDGKRKHVLQSATAFISLILKFSIREKNLVNNYIP